MGEDSIKGKWWSIAHKTVICRSDRKWFQTYLSGAAKRASHEDSSMGVELF